MSEYKDNDKSPLSSEEIKQIQQVIALKKQLTQFKKERKAEKTLSKITLKSGLMWVVKLLTRLVKIVDYCVYFIIFRNDKSGNILIKEAKAPILFGVYVILIFVVVGLFWASTAPLDSAAVASGVVISKNKKQEINHPEGGVIKEIFVNQGDFVKEGSKLLEFQSVRIKADYDSTLNQYRIFLATEARLMTEISGDSKVIYPEFLVNDCHLTNVEKIIQSQNDLFLSKKSYIQAEKQSFKQKINQERNSIKGYEAKIRSLNKKLSSVEERVVATSSLKDKGYAHQAALLEIESQAIALKSEIDIANIEIARMKQEIIITEIALMNVDYKNTVAVLNELKDVQLHLAQVRERYYALQDYLERVVVLSPITGIVNNINYYTVGSTIPAQQQIMVISPVDDKLLVEAKIEPKNIDSIRLGLTCKLKFSAFKSRTSPLFIGKVVSLSPDIVIDQKNYVDPRYANGYYLATIELDNNHKNKMAKSKNIQIQTGMQAEIQIVTGTRTLLRYLLDPVYDAMFKGFKEK